jgi:hypothetical protein
MKKTDFVESLVKFSQRQNARRKMIFGVNEHCKPFGPGVSYAGVYIHLGGNIETSKRIHKETLECLRLMPKPKLP